MRHPLAVVVVRLAPAVRAPLALAAVTLAALTPTASPAQLVDTREPAAANYLLEGAPGSTGYQWLAQSFIAPAGSLNGITFFGKSTVPITGALYAFASGAPTGAALFTQTVSATVGGQQFTFANGGIALTAGATYLFTLTPAANGFGFLYEPEPAGFPADLYAGGQAYFTGAIPPRTGWFPAGTGRSAGADLEFVAAFGATALPDLPPIVFGPPPPDHVVPEPGSFALVAGGIVLFGAGVRRGARRG